MILLKFNFILSAPAEGEFMSGMVMPWWRGPAPGGNKSPNSNNGMSVVRPSSAFHALRRAAHSSILIVAAIPCLYTFCTNSGMFASPEGNSQVPKI